jgi:hypothetical protein
LAPVTVRPASVLRMPRYNLSPEEAAKLVNYFAAAAEAEFPYRAEPLQRSEYLGQQERAEPGRLDDALRMIVEERLDCLKCHRMGDYAPGGGLATTLAPDLEAVGRRIRAGYLRRWLANPKTVLPYTAMTVNFPPSGPPLEKDLFGGRPLEQLDAVRDLLLNYDWYAKRRTSIRRLVEPEPRGEPVPPDQQN